MPDRSAGAPALSALALLQMPRVGLREWHRRVRAAGSAATALAECPDRSMVEGAYAAAVAQLAAAAACGATVLTIGDAAYPSTFHLLTTCDSADLSPAPPVVFVRGNLGHLTRPAVAIVGTRQASTHGLHVAERLGRDCASAGALVVSGLARGIDAAAHAGALDARGATAAIIGTGIDIAYPAAHRALQERIARDGLVITEWAPGVRATRGSFPERNRLIAALADVTVVVEAGRKSGALLTAHAANALHRTTAAVPGPFDTACSLGSNELLRDGAQVITTVDDLLALLHLARADDPTERIPPALTGAERAIWDVLGAAPLDLDVVVERAGWAADACLAAVTTLELKGLVRASSAGALQRT